MNAIDQAIAAAKRLSERVGRMRFASPVTHVYNPLAYAWGAHERYIRKMNPQGTRVLFLGMNPGPWGMAQTGVPFGQVAAVRDWLEIDAPIDRPTKEHPARRVEGLACPRSEVSGERLWGLFRQRFSTPEKFFRDHYVANYCPLAFMEASGRNRTPDKLPARERASLEAACDEHLAALLTALRPTWAIGVGGYAENCFRRVADQGSPHVLRILHPSPASPSANRGWSAAATTQLEAAGVWRSR